MVGRDVQDDFYSVGVHKGVSLVELMVVLAPFKERKAFWISDAPIDLNAAWLSGPEVQPEIIRNSKGPHGGGFYFARGFQEGVGLMRNGEEIR